MRDSTHFPALKEARFVAASYEREQGRSLVSAYDVMHEKRPEFTLMLESAAKGWRE